MIATTAFEPAANAQSAALNFDPAIVYVPHPIQDRTDDEMREIADATVEALIAKLTGPQD